MEVQWCQHEIHSFRVRPIIKFESQAEHEAFEVAIAESIQRPISVQSKATFYMFSSIKKITFIALPYRKFITGEFARFSISF